MDARDVEKALNERRAGGDRQQLDGEVVIELDGGELRGVGRNVSESGVYFVAEAAPRVLVRLPGEPAARAAELVRLENLGPGRVGVAVRFFPQ